jgi:hypothetical protein
MRTWTIGATAACVLAGSVMLSAQSARETALRQSTPVVPSPTAWGLNGYSLVLVVGDMQPGGTSESVPSAARKALNDVQTFLPYKRYQLLDAEWMLCCTGFGSTVSGRVHGPDGREYQYSIVTDPGDHAQFSLRFSMRDLSATAGGGRGGARSSELSDTARAEYSRQLYEATKERDEAELTYTRAKQMADVGNGQQSDVAAAQTRVQRTIMQLKALQAELGQAQGRGTAAGATGPNIMDNTFFISLGETVVIGTSRLKGDQALIALLTAVPKSGRKN